MILVILGTQKFQFNRLLKEIDTLITTEIITEPVFAQIGISEYIPTNYSYTRFLPQEEFDQKIRECRLLITHSGVGTIMNGIKCGKPVIVYPRLKKYGEHVDDHQLDIAHSFSDLSYVLLSDGERSLGELILLCNSFKFERYSSERKQMIKVIKDYLNNI